MARAIEESCAAVLLLPALNDVFHRMLNKKGIRSIRAAASGARSSRRPFFQQSMTYNQRRKRHARH